MTHQQAVVFREADLPHYFRDGSDTDSISIFWTYASAGVTRTIVETGQPHLIDVKHRA